MNVFDRPSPRRPPYPITWAQQKVLVPALPNHLQKPVLFALNTGARDDNVCGLHSEWEAQAPGVYRVEAVARLGDKEIGRSSSYFQRADGSLESFSAEQDVALLTRLAEQTGGAYYPIERAEALPEQLTYSPAGISVPEVRDLWDMPAWLVLLFLLKGTEWVLRKRWRTI